MNRQKKIKILLTLGMMNLLVWQWMIGQTIAFHHLNTSNGLLDNNARAAAVDHKGFLWIGTLGGLNVYNGFEIQSYTSEQIPDLMTNGVLSLFADSKNKLWIGFGLSTYWMDEKRNFHRVTIMDSLSRFTTRLFLESQQFGTILFTNFGLVQFDSLKNSWQHPSWLPKDFTRSTIKDAEFIENDKLVYVIKSGMKIMDYRTGEICIDYPCVGAVSVTKLPNGKIALGFESGLVQYLDIHTGDVVKEYHLFPESPGNAVQPRIFHLRGTARGTVVIATGTSGLVTIDSSGVIQNYLHDPIDPVSLTANNTNKVWAGQDGEIVALTGSSGVSIGNTYYKRAGFTKVFRDQKDQLYDNYLNEIAFDEKGNLWLCGYDRLVRWNRQTKESKYYQYFSPKGTLSQGMEFRAMCFDHDGRIWFSVINEGLVVFDPVHEKFKRIAPDTSLGKMTSNTNISDLMLGTDGLIWIATTDGFYTIDPQSEKMRNYVNHPVLKKIAKGVTASILEDRQGKLWFGTARGLYGYDHQAGELLEINYADSLLSAYVWGMIQGSNEAIYVASGQGFNIVLDGKVIKSISRLNGLRYDRCESFQEDLLNNIWVSNNKCLVKYDPKNGSLQYFEESAGINTSGFRLGGSTISDDGELFWAPQNGINYFYPEQLLQSTAPLKVSVFGLEVNDTIFYLGPDDDFNLRYARNRMSFHVAAVNLSGSGEIKYHYRLTGYDDDWKSDTDIHKIEYAGIPPGDYEFHLRASADGETWSESINKVKISVLSPLWMKWWFSLGSTGLILGLLGWFVSQRARKLQERNEALETELAISYFASSMHEQQTVESILWDVAKNCIGRLQFEDCVIYLLDHDTKLLHQVAAHGPKGKTSFEIHQPLDIPLGKGIVGSAALSGEPELIGNTEKDPRYIVDDEMRYSEIAVPIVSGGKVLGVIDCEHSKKNFFTKKHLSMLTTIASLCANKIVRIQAEEEKQLAQLTLMDTQRKMSEVEMQALRAQMNPHFIFNCLNSINRYIVKSDQVTASLYLTRFAKLIRLILDNSNSQNVLLSNELEALRLYIEMESLRFDKKFHYKINVAENVNPDSIEMPPLIIQPYVENAIWHGLLHKEDEGKLLVDLNMIQDGVLQITIEDNGVGRERAMELKSKSALTRKSLGMKLTDDRIALLNKDTAVNASIQILDLKNGHGEATGTRVVFTIPIY